MPGGAIRQLRAARPCSSVRHRFCTIRYSTRSDSARHPCRDLSGAGRTAAAPPAESSAIDVDEKVPPRSLDAGRQSKLVPVDPAPSVVRAGDGRLDLDMAVLVHDLAHV